MLVTILWYPKSYLLQMKNVSNHFFKGVSHIAPQDINGYPMSKLSLSLTDSVKTENE